MPTPGASNILNPRTSLASTHGGLNNSKGLIYVYSNSVSPLYNINDKPKNKDNRIYSLYTVNRLRVNVI